MKSLDTIYILAHIAINCNSCATVIRGTNQPDMYIKYLDDTQSGSDFRMQLKQVAVWEIKREY